MMQWERDEYEDQDKTQCQDEMQAKSSSNVSTLQQ